LQVPVFLCIRVKGAVQCDNQLFYNKNTAGYNEVQVPHLVNEASAYGTGQLPDKGRNPNVP
jgi:hypothetical protein